MKILYIVNIDWFFVSHRLPIAKKALSEGHEVHIATRFTTKKELLSKSGFVLHHIAIKRSDINLFYFIKDILNIFGLYLKIKPDLVHLITIKPVLIGLIAGFFNKRINYVASISGLGYVFSAKTFRAKVKRALITFLYKISFSHKTLKVIFQNKNDLRIITEITSLPLHKTILINGSGVDLNKYVPSSINLEKPVVLFAGRLLFSKGIKEFIAVSKKVKKARFLIAGDIDPENPESISRKNINKWSKLKNVEFLGHQEDMVKIIQESSMVVLPSYYGEGLPKILIEASACGIPVITTDHPGCRNAIIPGLTGLLVPIKDNSALEKAIKKLLNNKDLRIKMGQESRKMALDKFDINRVVDLHLSLYRSDFK